LGEDTKRTTTIGWQGTGSVVDVMGITGNAVSLGLDFRTADDPGRFPGG